MTPLQVRPRSSSRAPEESSTSGWLRFRLTACGYWQSGIYLEHVATGLFIYGAYGREFLNTNNGLGCGLCVAFNPFQYS